MRVGRKHVGYAVQRRLPNGEWEDYMLEGIGGPICHFKKFDQAWAVACTDLGRVVEWKRLWGVVPWPRRLWRVVPVIRV